MQTSAHSVWPQAPASEGQEENETLQRRRSHLQIEIVITCIYRPEKKKSINLQNYKINRPFPRSPSFTVTGNERKRKKTACKSRNNAQLS